MQHAIFYLLPKTGKKHYTVNNEKKNFGHGLKGTKKTELFSLSCARKRKGMGARNYNVC